MTTSDDLIGPKEASKILGVSTTQLWRIANPKDSLQRLEVGGFIEPVHRLKQMTLYRRSDVLALAEIRSRRAKLDSRLNAAGVAPGVQRELASRSERAEMHRLRRERSLAAQQKLHGRLTELVQRRLELQAELAAANEEIDRVAGDLAVISAKSGGPA